MVIGSGITAVAARGNRRNTMLFLDYLAYHNRFAAISLIEKMSFGLGGLFFAVVSSNELLHVGLLTMMSILLIWAGMPITYWLRLWGTLLPFLSISLITILFSFSTGSFPALFMLKIGPCNIGITTENLLMAQEALLRSAASVSCLLFLAGTTPLAHVAAWGSRFTPIRPVLEVALLAYRFIFVVMHTASQIYTAQQSRLGYSHIRQSIRSIGILAANVGRKSFITARDLFIGLTSRNYDDRLVFRYPRQNIHPVRLILILVLWVGALLVGH